MRRQKLTDRRPAFYEDPERPGQARHRRCLMRARIHPEQTGLRPSDGPCWICDGIASAYLQCDEARADVRRLVGLATALQRLSKRAFKLAEEVRAETALGYVKRTHIERNHPAVLRAFRSALDEARRQAQIPGSPAPGWRWRPEQAGGFDANRWLKSDPTSKETVCLQVITRDAGVLSVKSRAVQAAAARDAKRLQSLYGMGPDELAHTLASEHKASTHALAEEVVARQTARRPLTERDRQRARALAQRWRTRACRRRARPASRERALTVRAANPT